jgi:acyl-CoA thioesterase FadM
MSGLISRWPVLQEHPVGAADLDSGGRVRDERVAGWVAAVQAAYLERCAVLTALRERSGLALRDEVTHLPSGASLGRPVAVVVSAGVTEVLPQAFVLAVRLRTDGGERDVAVNARVRLWLEDHATGEASAIGDELRDEFIALAHAAEQYN